MKMNEAPITAMEPPVPEPDGDRWPHWLSSPPGKYALAWEQEQFDAEVADLFGFHALQCGLPELDALRENRMRHRFRACQPDDDPGSGVELPESARADLWLDHYEALPFASQSLDLVVLPHVLEFACDPHQVLREVDRVLRPEGRVIVSGFNPVSLWGARQIVGRGIGRPFLPEAGQFIGLPRLRDWFKLLSFELERGRFGCYRPPCRSEKWLERTRFMEAAGDRWWPICGAVYFVSAVKRVRGMRLLDAIPSRSRLRRVPVAVIAPRHVQRRSQSRYR
jgi:SAM-dependent methyltransferase